MLSLSSLAQDDDNDNALCILYMPLMLEWRAKRNKLIG
jgi:hypothetical protein